MQPDKKTRGKVVILTSVHQYPDTRIYEREALTLATHGYELTLIVTGSQPHRTAENIRIVSIPRPGRRSGRLLNWPRFLKAALAQRADIYHFHDPDLLFVGVLIRLLTGRPVIYDCHEPNREVLGEREWLPRILRVPLGLIFEVVERSLAGLLSAVIIANPGQQAQFPAATLVRNFPKLEAYDLQRHPAVHSNQIVHLGEMSPARGITDFVQACGRVTHKNMKAILVGKYGDEETRLAVDRLKAAYDLNGCLKHMGMVPYQQVLDLLNQSAIGIVPFRNKPALRLSVPTKMFEYMACALPVIATDLPTTTPFIQEADCGLIIPPEDPTALAEAITYLLDHPEESRRLGINGRRMVVEKYNWACEGDKLLELYQDLLSGA
jgi:glycosyltransferase involved in cell wall biosynthesis